MKPFPKLAVPAAILAACLVGATVAGSRLVDSSRVRAASREAQWAASDRLDMSHHVSLEAIECERAVKLYVDALRIGDYQEAMKLQFQVPSSDVAYTARELKGIREYSSPLLGWKSCKIGRAGTSVPLGQPIGVPVSVIDAHGKHMRLLFTVLWAGQPSVLRFAIVQPVQPRNLDAEMNFGLY